MEQNFDMFDLNKHKLDEEWLEQPKLFHTSADKLADARKAMAKAKANFELVEAELSLDVRKNSIKYGLEKATENSIGATVIVQQKYQKAQQAYFEAKHEMDVLEATVNALEHRKKALEMLVQLQARDYFSEPTPPKEDRQRFDELERGAVFKGKKRRNDEG